VTEITQLEAVARADNRMLEIDGPTQAYFEIPTDAVVKNSVMLITYVSIVWPITQEHVEDNLQNAVAGDIVTAIKNELFKLGGGIIWWRMRPNLAVYNGPQGQIFKVRCRVATSPPLSNKAWERLHRYHEGRVVTE
jgi:hypothetical protein